MILCYQVETGMKMQGREPLPSFENYGVRLLLMCKFRSLNLEVHFDLLGLLEAMVLGTVIRNTTIVSHSP